MSEVKRYSLALHKVKGKFESPEFERDNGEWVKFDDYARLKAEVEELRGNPDLLTVYLYAAELCKDDIKTLKDEVKRLTLLQVETLDERNKAEAEVERLRYVGDGMAVMVGHIEVTGDAHRMMLELSKEWEAAKEGKSV